MSRPGSSSFRWASALWAALTAALLLMPGSALETGALLPPLLEELLAWAVHFVLFFVLAWLVRRTVRPCRLPGVGGARGHVPTITALTLYCVALEVLQVLVPNRSFQPLDIVFGCLGIWGGWRRGRARTNR